MAKHKVLSTKKLEPSLVEQAKENGFDITEQEFISVKTIVHLETYADVFNQLKKSYAAFTSVNAVNSLAAYIHPNAEGDRNYMPEWKVFCLAGRTKEAILNVKHLKENIIAEAENAKDLANKIIEQGVKEIAFFCGDKRRDELPDILKEAGIKVHEVVVYETIETPVIVPGDFDAILFFSPSAVQSFFLVNEIKKNTVCFAIGQTTANSISSYTDNKIVVSESPSQEMMLAAIQSHFENSKSYD